MIHVVEYIILDVYGYMQGNKIYTVKFGNPIDALECIEDILHTSGMKLISVSHYNET